MTGLAIVIPRRGPGTGPVVPGALYKLATQPTLRWEAARAAGAPGSTQGAWRDVIQGKLLTEAGAAPKVALRSPGEKATLEFPLNLGGDLRLASGAGVPQDFTYAMVLRAPDVKPVNNLLNTRGWLSGVAGNGHWQIAGIPSGGGAGFHAQGAFPLGQWNICFGSFKLSDPGASRSKVNDGAALGPGTITASPDADTVRITMPPNYATLQVASLIIWDGHKNLDQLNAEYAAIRANHPVLN